MFTKGTKIEIKTAAHPYSFGGYTDPNCIVPAETRTAVVKSVRQVKNGTRVRFHDNSATQPYDRDFAMDVERMPHTTFRVMS